jgi:hypothetical protein
LTALHASGLKKCVLVAPVIKGSVMLSGLQDCVVIVGAQQVSLVIGMDGDDTGLGTDGWAQFRIHTSNDVRVLLHVASLPVIEHSTNLLFGPYPSALLSDPVSFGCRPGCVGGLHTTGTGGDDGRVDCVWSWDHGTELENVDSGPKEDC